MSTRGLRDVQWSIVHGVKEHQAEARSKALNAHITTVMNLKKQNQKKKQQQQSNMMLEIIP